MRVHKSNRLEELADRLLENLFLQNDPFSKTVVIVPGEKQVAFLKEYIAQKKGIYAGFIIKPLRSFPRSQALPLGKIIPTQKQLVLAIDAECLSTRSFSEPRKRYEYAQDLANLFVEYSQCTLSEIESWKKKGSDQALLWKKIFSSQGPYKALPEALCNYQDKFDQVHVFGFLYLLRSYIETFIHLDASFYMLNPCEEFWEDEISDWLLLGMEEDAESAHPILANWTLAMRKTQSFLDPECDKSEPCFVANPHPSFLHFIQNDLLTMRSTPPMIPPDPTFDRTVQIHACTSYFREVEVLKCVIEDLLSENKDIAPKDILILSPHLDRYVPAIQALFVSCPNLCYQILDVNLKEQKEEFEALYALFTAIESGYKSEKIFEVLAYPCVKARWDIAHLEEDFIGINNLHGSQRCWLAACKRALFGHVFPESYFSSLDHTPCTIGDRENLTALLDFLAFLEEIEVLMQETFSAKLWAEKILAVLEQLTSLSEQAKTIFQKMAASFALVEETAFSFEDIMPHMKAFLAEQSVSYTALEKNVLTFSPLKEGSIHPAKLVMIMGLDEESFPNQEAKKAFSEIETIKLWSYIPTQAEKARLLFLEALLSARLYFHVSYCNVHPEDQKALKPCLALQEWASDLCLQAINHPPSRLDPWYFSKNSPFLFYTQKDLASVQQPTIEINSISLSHWHKVCSFQDKKLTFSLKQIQDALKNAPYFYLKNIQGVKFPFQEKLETHEDFFLAKQKIQIFEKTLCESGLTAVEKAEKAGFFPNPPFMQRTKEEATKRYNEELCNISFYRQRLSLGEVELCSVDGIYLLEKFNWRNFLHSVGLMAALKHDYQNQTIIFACERKMITPDMYPQNLLSDLDSFFSAAAMQALPWHYKFSEGYFLDENEFCRRMQMFCLESRGNKGFSEWLTLNPELKNPELIYRSWALFFQEKLGTFYELYKQL